MTTDGSDTQLIVTTSHGADNPASVRWTEASVQPRTVSADSSAVVGASYYAGFQLSKRVRSEALTEIGVVLSGT